MQTYRVAYIKTYFDNMVFPYLTPEEMNIEAGKMYLVNSKFGEEIGRAMSGVKYITLEQFPLKRPASQQNHEDLDNLNNKLVDIEGVDLANLIKEEAASDTLVVEEGIEKKIENFRVLREASEQEVDEWEKLNKNNKDRAFNDALKFIKELNLPMRLISVHFLYQKKKVIFNFTAENRVDFRELVKKLAAIYKTRIEMRQIGVRDASKILGGCGVCGIQLCCTRSNCHINSIYLKMAKDQGFAVSSSKLTGVCGRLMCCLAYEADFYAQEREKYPPLNSLIQDSSKSYRVVSYNFIKGEIIGEDENHHLKKFELEKLKFVTATESDAKVYVVESE